MNAELVVGVSLGLCLAALLFWVEKRREAARERRWDAQRLAAVQAIRTRFGAGGQIAGRAVSVGLDGAYLVCARFELRRSVLPPSVRIVEFADGPYQKQEERHIGGAHEVGDTEFDAKFLAYGERDEVAGLDAGIRAVLLRHWIEGVSVRATGVSLWVPIDPEQAVLAVVQALALCDALEERVERA